MKKLIIAISGLILFANSAISAGFSPSIGVSGSWAAFSATGTESEFTGGAVVEKSKRKVKGAFATEYASVFVELGLNDAISLGLDYVPMSFETPQNISNENNPNQNRVSAKFSKLTTVYAKINVPLGGTYLKLGYSSVDVISQEAMSSGSTYGNESTNGMTVGLGYGHEIGNGISVRAEVMASEFDDVSTKSNATSAERTQIDVSDMIGARGTISVVKSF